jgi:hypothetical protein
LLNKNEVAKPWQILGGFHFFSQMKNLLNATDRQALELRLNNLHLNCRRNWGKLGIHELFPHLTEPLRVAIGAKQVPHVKSIFYNSLFGKCIVWFLPWPKGAPTAPEFLPGTGLTASTQLENDRRLFFETLEKFVAKDRFEASPVFGDLSKSAWGRLMWRHIDHHLRQFSA